jgi:hypothetical protein
VETTRDLAASVSALCFSRGAVWNNTGDTAKLRNKAGKLIDRCSYDGTGSSVAC